MQSHPTRSLLQVCVGLLLLFLSAMPTTAQVSGLPPIKIVHLGDSYSAGNGARSEAGVRNYVGVEGCFRSPDNWGEQFADSLRDTFSVTYINRACSGGVVADITKRRNMWDYSLKSGGVCPTSKYPDEETYEDALILGCARYLEPQIRAVDNSVDLVLMTMGGNDLGFATIVATCFSAVRTSLACQLAIDRANDGLDKLKGDLVAAFGDIHAKLKSGGKIAYVAYPNLLLDEPYILASNYGGSYVSVYNVGAELRKLSIAGEQVQREAVAAANLAAGEEYVVFFDGTKALFAGHEPDPDLLVGNPDRWIHEFELIDPEGIEYHEWFHPNALGHEQWGQALSVFETFGASGGTLTRDANIDIAFVVDTTGSMGGSIAQVRNDLTSLVDQLRAATDSYRVAVVSYRDFPSRTGYSLDYPSRVDQTFTDDPALIQAAINSLTADGGGDWEESVYSGIQAAIELPWRPGVTKTMIVIGDAPALSPEPVTGLTPAQIVANSIAVDPVQVVGADVGALNYYGDLATIAAGTGGSVVPSTTNLTATISEILDQAASQPFAWIGSAYSGQIGQPVAFDASGSYDPAGQPITRYEWDFNGDGTFDLTTNTPSASHTYSEAFEGYAVVRVTSAGGSALASARTIINEQGYAGQSTGEPCQLDENGYSIILAEDGRPLTCIADHWPEYGDNGTVVLSVLHLPSIVSP